MKMLNSVKRVYVDTSVVGGLFDKEFRLQTEPFWKAVNRGEITVIVSDLLDSELAQAPEVIRKLVSLLPGKIR